MPAELMYRQKSIMSMERTISSWAVVDWRDEMSREELLATRIRQLERRLEDVERAKAKLHVDVVRARNKGRFDRLTDYDQRRSRKAIGFWLTTAASTTSTRDA